MEYNSRITSFYYAQQYEIFTQLVSFFVKPATIETFLSFPSNKLFSNFLLKVQKMD
mgnify:CR=1 FL=1